MDAFTLKSYCAERLLHFFVKSTHPLQRRGDFEVNRCLIKRHIKVKLTDNHVMGKEKEGAEKCCHLMTIYRCYWKSLILTCLAYTGPSSQIVSYFWWAISGLRVIRRLYRCDHFVVASQKKEKWSQSLRCSSWVLLDVIYDEGLKSKFRFTFEACFSSAYIVLTLCWVCIRAK